MKSLFKIGLFIGCPIAFFIGLNYGSSILSKFYISDDVAIEFVEQQETTEQYEIVVIESSVRDDEECSLTDQQLSVIRFSYHFAEPYDFGYTLAAIALKESNAGRWKINIQDPSGGLYHVTLDKVLKLNDWEDTPFNRNRAMQQLVNNDKIAAKIALEELQMWKDINSGDWLSTWASYNHGYNGPNTERGQAYAEHIRELIQKIQYCRWII